VLLSGAEPKVLQTREEDGFRLLPEQLKAAVGPKTKALILCSPSNPTGAAYAAEHLSALAEAAEEGDYWIIVDEIYGELVYGGFEQRSLVELAPSLRERIIVVDGVSKTYAMTGWRIGWTIAPAHVAKAIEKIQGQSTSNPTAVAQHAAIAALSGPKEPVAEMSAAFAERRDAIVAGLNAIDGVRCRMPEGAFYAFPNISELVGKRAGDQLLEDDSAVVGYLLNEAKVALIPGSAF
jgi:aspartate aminotransferase